MTRGAVTVRGVSLKLRFSRYSKPGSGQHQTRINNTFKTTPTLYGMTAPIFERTPYNVTAPNTETVTPSGVTRDSTNLFK
ncbi:MAG: hypothetical protein EF813_11435 [Methanosarcinales archaeon]|nr:MAG: hypothetical protein EF813_11435 [Methanosarcinales archaeon]